MLQTRRESLGRFAPRNPALKRELLAQWPEALLPARRSGSRKWGPHFADGHWHQDSELAAWLGVSIWEARHRLRMALTHYEHDSQRTDRPPQGLKIALRGHPLREGYSFRILYAKRDVGPLLKAVRQHLEVLRREGSKQGLSIVRSTIARHSTLAIELIDDWQGGAAGRRSSKPASAKEMGTNGPLSPA